MNPPRKNYDRYAKAPDFTVFTANYGETSAFTFFGKRYVLLQVISEHDNFYIWGPGSCSGAVVTTVGLSMSDDLKTFNNVTQAGIVTCIYCMNNENNLLVYVCTSPKLLPQSVWASVKHFN